MTIKTRINHEQLIVLADTFGIDIIYDDLAEGLLGMADAETKVIFLDTSLKNNSLQHKCVLAEEIGHILYPPRPGHIRYHSKKFNQSDNCCSVQVIVAQDERKALDWATGVLLGNVDFPRIKEVGASSIAELAEHFDVEPWFLEHRIGYLRRKARDAGQKVKWKDFIQRVK